MLNRKNRPCDKGRFFQSWPQDNFQTVDTVMDVSLDLCRRFLFKGPKMCHSPVLYTEPWTYMMERVKKVLLFYLLTDLYAEFPTIGPKRELSPLKKTRFWTLEQIPPV